MPVLFLDPGEELIGKPAGTGAAKLAEFFAHDYHQVTDTVKPDWDLAGAVENIQLLYDVGRMIDAGDAFPTWKPGAEFKAIRDQMLAAPH